MRPIAPPLVMPLVWLMAACLPLAAMAAGPLDGRWEGAAQIPGQPMPVVLDISSTGGVVAAWITLPGRGSKGLPLAVQRRPDGSLRIDATAAFSQMGPPRPVPEFVLALQPAGDGAPALQGHFAQAGHQAPLRLLRSGPAQPEPAPVNSVLTPELSGVWRGSYSIGGQPRQVTLTLAPDSAQAVIVGRRTSQVAFDGIQLGARFITLASSSTQITLEGRWRATAAGGEIDGLFIQGPYEAPLVLRKEGRP